jgi:hypothetical protein
VTDNTVPRFPGVQKPRKDSRFFRFELQAPGDLVHHFGAKPGERAWAFRCSLKTADIREANEKAKVLHAEWAARFEELRRKDNPSRAEPTPELARLLAHRVHASIRAADENMREFPDAALALMARAGDVRARALLATGEPMPDTLAGRTHEEAYALRRFNASALADASSALATRNFAAAVKWADVEAHALGMRVDWNAPGTHDVLREVLEAWRTAYGEVARIDAGEVVPRPALPEPAPHETVKDAAKGHKIADALDAWLTAKKRSDKTAGVFKRHAAMFADIMGDPVLETLTLADGYRFAEAVQAWAIKEKRTADTANNVLSSVRAMLTLARRPPREWLKVDPLDGARVEEGGAEGVPRDAWEVEDLPKLFDAPVFTRYELPKTPSAGADACYWVPVILAFTGARPDEVAQLYTDDVYETVDGGLAIEFRENAARQQSLKKRPGAKVSPSWRSTPVHSQLIRLGFRDYWQAMAEGGPRPLFPALSRKTQNGAVQGVSKWFNGTHKTAQGFGPESGRRLDLHSFRHTVTEALTFADVKDDIARAIVGHASEDVHGKNYGRKVRHQADRQRPFLERLRYPDLNLPPVFPPAGWAPPAPAASRTPRKTTAAK